MSQGVIEREHFPSLPFPSLPFPSFPFLRAALYAVLRRYSDLKLLNYMYGSGGTGNTTLTQIASALVGDANTHVATLRAINADQSEAVNLANQKLMPVGDTESCTTHLSQLKALTGGEALRARRVYTQSTGKAYLAGTLIMTGNQLLDIRDSAGAIYRTIRALIVRCATCQRRGNHCSSSTRGASGLVRYVLNHPGAWLLWLLLLMGTFRLTWFHNALEPQEGRDGAAAEAA